MHMFCIDCVDAPGCFMQWACFILRCCECIACIACITCSRYFLIYWCKNKTSHPCYQKDKAPASPWVQGCPPPLLEQALFSYFTASSLRGGYSIMRRRALAIFSGSVSPANGITRTCAFCASTCW